MGIAKMKLVNITADNEYLSDVLLKFVDLNYFHPELATKFVDTVHGLTTLNEENPITEVLNNVQEVVARLNVELPQVNVRSRDYDLEEITSYVDGVDSEFQRIDNIRQDLKKVIQENKDALVQIKNIENMDLNLDDLFECKYTKIRFGRLPIQNVEKLQYYRNRPFIFKSFSTDDAYSWCLYMTTEKYEGDVDNIFSSLYFERIRIPEFVHGTPGRAKESLQEEIDSDLKQLEHVEKVLEDKKEGWKENLAKVVSELSFLNHTYESYKYVVGLGERFSITGFVAEDDVTKLKEDFQELKEVEIEVRPAHSDKRLTPPTKLKNGWFARPFSMFIEMYGTPEYDGFDPTPIVAITYSILFGMMFGDVGQGLCVILVGWLASKYKRMKLGDIMIRIGIFSTIFGFVFGSVFGNETMLNPLYHALLGLVEKPIEVMSAGFILPLLMTAVGIGAFLNMFSIVLNIISHSKDENKAEFLFSQNGIAGFVFYGSIVLGVALTAMGCKVFNVFYIVIFILLPLVCIFLKEPLERKLEGHEMFPEGFGSFCMEGFFELFEICLSYITNTISYLRVGGFVLSHAGMMMAVTMIMEMAGGFAGVIIGIFGNILVMCLEGLIVGIQVLRLEFYEMFSRYFTGNGRVFKTIND